MGVVTVGFSLSGGTMERLAELERRLADMSIPMEEFGRAMMSSVSRNFVEGGRPERWRPLAESTRRRKGANAPLVDTGRLSGSIGFTAGPAGLNVFARAAYASLHQHGGRPGMGTAAVPARPFLVFQDEDVRALVRLVEAHISQDG